MTTREQPFHIVDISPWPWISGFLSLSFMSGLIFYMNRFTLGKTLLLLSTIGLLFVLFLWWRDVIREGTLEGEHNHQVEIGLKAGMLLFIISEIFFFVALFWAFFHSSLISSIEIGAIWPPLGINAINPYGIPLYNTLLLLSSGATVTWAHHSLLQANYKEALYSIIFTLALIIIFIAIQVFEYKEALIGFSDGIYGSVFFMATGFHGFHMIMGATFLTVVLVRFLAHHFTDEHHFGFEAAAWYLHLLDVVWIFLYLAIYWWGY